MKNLNFLLIISLATACGAPEPSEDRKGAQTEAVSPEKLVGAWTTQIQPDSGEPLTGVTIITDGYLSSTLYSPDRKVFGRTVGGAWRLNDENKLLLAYEFHTEDSAMVGDTVVYSFALKNDTLTAENGTEWTRIDGGEPGKLAGAWLITGRKREGEISRREPGPRKTMKILSGSRFQWVAYNTDTGQFFGTGGGNYTTKDSTYTENIEFFSRDSSRVGATLEFSYRLDSGEWHHTGLSSKGDSIYEIWTPRSKLDAMQSSGR